MFRQKKPRRGVVLLLVISLLALFVLIAATYALVAGQYRNAAVAMSRRDITGDAPRRELDQAMYMLLRDTAQDASKGIMAPSALRGHSLLADLYGLNDGVCGSVTSVPNAPSAVAGGQFVSFGYTPAANSIFSSYSGYYNGAVLTMLTGAAKGYSTFVVGYSSGVSLQIEAFNSDGTNIPIPAAGDVFRINGRPFNGTGMGYLPAGSSSGSGSPAIPNIDQTDSNGNAVGLLPNYAGYPNPVNLTGNAAAFASPAVTLYGDVDESWDAPDVHNLFLANVPPNAASSANIITPSFHRPMLINYWMNKSTSAWNATLSTLQRQVIFRPITSDHPNFTGSNPNYTALTGPWDVDNDGDGIMDSIWIDPGLPITTSRDGRKVKRLFAIMCQDLDSRINLNAHGNWKQLDTNTYSDGSTGLMGVSGYYAGVSNSPVILPRGGGYGPAEINPVSFFSTLGEYSNILSSRYGGDGLPGISDLTPFASSSPQLDTLSFLKLPGVPNNYSNFSLQTSYTTPPDIWGRGAVAIDYLGMPVTSYLGQNGETLDHPYQINLSSNTVSQDSPYSLMELERLLRFNDADASRMNSRLAALAPQTFLNSSSSSTARQLVTTRGSYIPAPNVAIPAELRTNVNLANMYQSNTTASNPAGVNTVQTPTLLDLYAAKLQQGMTTPTPANIATQLSIIVPPEILKGQLFDLNRPFGNGIDDNGNLVVDEPGEGGPAWNNGVLPQGLSGVLPPAFTSATFEPLNDDPAVIAPGVVDNRQIYARHLYCLALLVKDGFPTSPTTKPDSTTAQQLAQWAVNVVDFRDADSIMTGFEFDLNPWDGWDVDGDLTTTGDKDRAVVWGAERPELLITETLVFHDRRTEDLDSEKPVQNPSAELPAKTTDPVNPDADFDQRLMPRSGVFIELYNPWATTPASLYTSSSTPSGGVPAQVPAEFYANNNQWQSGIYLNKVNAAGSPVWRLAFRTLPVGVEPDPSSGSIKFDRTIYFVADATTVQNIKQNIDINTTTGVNNAGEIFYSSLPIAPILPSCYAVIGSAGQSIDAAGAPLDQDGNGITDYTTPIGRLNTATEGSTSALQYSATRRFVLQPHADPTKSLAGLEQGINVAGVISNSPTANGTKITDIQRPIGIVIDQPRSLSLTDPVGGYMTTIIGGTKIPWLSTNSLNKSISPNTNGTYWSASNAGGEGAFSTPIDVPLDATTFNAQYISQGSGKQEYCWVYLQRLANPLLAWDTNTNPYRTIDAAPGDAYAFNGLGPESRGNPTAPPAPAFPTNFQSRQRGDWDQTKAANLLWRQDFGIGTRPASLGQTGDGNNFDITLRHSFGYLNTNYQPAFNSSNAPLPAYAGAPQSTPFPWLNWNNRPFASPFEVLQVPCYGSDQLLANYSNPAYLAAQSQTQNNYGTKTDPTKTGNATEYAHLLNMMYPGNGIASSNVAANIENLTRLFDYIETPSPFTGTEKWYSPSVFATGGAAGTSGQFYRPPFNKLSRFRDPGRVNINTVFIDPTSYASPVLDATFKGFPTMSNNPTLYANLLQSRQGYTGAASNPAYPTEFANPFRAASSADLMPAISTSSSPTMRQNGVNVTLLRPDPTNASLPLFNVPVSGHQYDDSSRNSYFRYQGVQRLANLLTNHSNVYAVWITVGYFEAESSATGTDAAHPDGCQIGQEIGLDSNTVERHRAFYIIDRSIPVAFEPGQDYNVDRAILVRRLLE